MLYAFYELAQASLQPWHTAVHMGREALSSPFSLLNFTPQARTGAAMADVFEMMTRRYGKPDWGLKDTRVGQMSVPVSPHPVWEKAWCRLLHFKRNPQVLGRARKAIGQTSPDPKLLLIAPLSGHYATLLRGTVEAFLPDHEVYITDWQDARMVPVFEGRFGLHDYIDYLREMIRFLGPQTHVIAVCQPGPPALAATALMAENEEPATPATLTLIGSPIDARKSPTAPNLFAENHDLDWFKRNMIYTTPWPYPGALRRVYPGFIQLTSFMNMNWEKHADAQRRFFEHLIEGDQDGAEKHREFYDEYLSVMDLPESFYLETLQEVFQEHRLARGLMMHRGRLVRPEALTKTALMTIEGEKDDISGIGQTQAAHDLCPHLPDTMREKYVQKGAGHYGVFSGSRFRQIIQPKISAFIRKHGDLARSALPHSNVPDAV